MNENEPVSRAKVRLTPLMRSACMPIDAKSPRAALDVVEASSERRVKRFLLSLQPEQALLDAPARRGVLEFLGDCGSALEEIGRLRLRAQ